MTTTVTTTTEKETKKKVREEGILVFVYGSLLRGFGNHGILGADSEFLHEDVTQDDNYYMVSLGGFPAIIPPLKDSKGKLIKEMYGVSTGKVKGELYSCSEQCLNRLDQLEGNGYFYKRQEVYLEGEEGTKVWMYMLTPQNSLRYIENPVVPRNEYNQFDWRLNQRNGKKQTAQEV